MDSVKSVVAGLHVFVARTPEGLNTSRVWTEEQLVNNSCSAQVRLQNVLATSTLCAAGFVLVVFSVFQMVKCKPFSWSSLLRVAVPIDFLSATPYRFIYCIMLSSLAADVTNDALNPDLYYRSSNGVVDAFLYFGVTPTVVLLKQGLLYFPVLACVKTSFLLPGHLLGLLYTLLMGACSVHAGLVIFCGCAPRGHLVPRDVAIHVVLALPTYVCYLATAGWYYYRSFREAIYFLLYRNQYNQFVNEDPHARYVARLFKCPPQRKKQYTHPRHKSIWQNLVDGFAYVLPWRSSPRVWFPLPFLAAISMAYTALFQLFVWLVSQEEIMLDRWRVFVDEFNITVELLKTLLPSQALFFDNVFYDAKSFVLSYQVLLPLGHWTGWSLSVLFVLYFIQTFHKHLLRLARGDLSFLLTSEITPTPTLQLVSTLRFISFLCGHIIFSFALYSLVVFILGTIGLIYYYFFKNFSYYGIHYWCLFMVPYVWAALLHMLQLALSRYVFLDRLKTKQVATIRFRCLYLVVAYFLLGFNMIYSMAMAFLRILGALVFNICMSFRLDRDIYMRGLEGWDLGHRTYVGYLYLESTSNNAIVRTFVNLVKKCVHSRHRCTHKWVWLRSNRSAMKASISQSTVTSANISTETQTPPYDHNHSQVMHLSASQRSKVARNRWHLSCMLLCNPSLRQYRCRAHSHVDLPPGALKCSS